MKQLDLFPADASIHPTHLVQLFTTCGLPDTVVSSNSEKGHSDCVEIWFKQSSDRDNYILMLAERFKLSRINKTNMYGKAYFPFVFWSSYTGVPEISRYAITIQFRGNAIWELENRHCWPTPNSLEK